MPIPSTPTELAYQRTDDQHSQLFLIADNPPTVWAAQINQSFTTTDGVLEIIYNNVTTGAYGDIIPGQTCWVGSAAGLCDIGIVRVRKAASSTVLYISETSDVVFANDLYLTVVDEFAIWARHPIITYDKVNKVEVVYMDADVTYTNQHDTCSPIVNMGTDRVKMMQVDYAVGSGRGNLLPVSTEWDASDSWILGSTILGYTWTAPGAYVTTDMSTATPTIWFNAAGRYRVKCIVYGNNGTYSIGYRYVWVIDGTNSPLPITDFTAKSVGEDSATGGVTFGVQVWSGAGPLVVRDRTKAILFTVDYYGGTLVSLGQVPGSENILAIGWIGAETTDLQFEQSSTTFNIYGANFWLGKEGAYPAGWIDRQDATAGWTNFEDLTLQKALYSMIYWRTTLNNCCDFTCTGLVNTLPLKDIEATAGSLWSQMTMMVDSTLLATIVGDRYGRIFVEVDTQLLSDADRAAIPIIMAITKEDWSDSISIERKIVPTISVIEVSGTSWNGTAARPYFSLATGKVYKRYGASIRKERLALTDQAHCNILSGRLLGKANNEYPRVIIKLAGNYRMINVTPHQLVSLSISATDTPRGIVWTNKLLIPKRIEYTLNNGMLLTTLECEPVATAEVSRTMTVPQTPDDNVIDPDPDDPPEDHDWDWPPYPGWDVGHDPGEEPPGTPKPPDPDGDQNLCKTDPNFEANGPYDTYMYGVIDDDQATNLYAHVSFWVRGSSAINKTTYVLSGAWMARTVDALGDHLCEEGSESFGNAWAATMNDDFYEVWALDAFYTKICMGVKYPVTGDGSLRSGYFEPPAGSVIAHLLITMTGNRFGIVDVTIPDYTPGNPSNFFVNWGWEQGTGYPGVNVPGTLDSGWVGGTYRGQLTNCQLVDRVDSFLGFNFRGIHVLDFNFDRIMTREYFKLNITAAISRAGEFGIVDTALRIGGSWTCDPPLTFVAGESNTLGFNGIYTLATVPFGTVGRVSLYTAWSNRTPSGDLYNTLINFRVDISKLATKQISIYSCMLYNVCKA